MKECNKNSEKSIQKYYPKLLEKLLIDKTTKSNIFWATDNYSTKNDIHYNKDTKITIDSITGIHENIIKPRALKTKKVQEMRTKVKAEVFTPSWVCNLQNNLIDEEWFGRPNVFNTPLGNSWITNPNKIRFPKKKTWKDYVTENRLEISCGEAPYLVSRYDTVSGKEIPIKHRIGLLDRKIRIINENASENEWFSWIIKAYQSIYGYEYQGDSLLLARENCLFSFADYVIDHLKREPTLTELNKLTNIITWNLWQMDGINNTVPFGVKNKVIQQNFFFSLKPVEEPIPCRIYDWKSNKSIEFRTLFKSKI